MRVGVSGMEVRVRVSNPSSKCMSGRVCVRVRMRAGVSGI